MLELIILFIFVIILAVWIGAIIGGIVVLVPVLVIFGIGNWLGFDWWQSLIVAFFALAIIQVLAERYYTWHFRKHAAEPDLPIELIGRQIEIEGKLTTILGTTGKKIVIKRKGDIFARKIDRHLARTKAGL